MEASRTATRDPQTPYGPKSRVRYADPGYQDDGVARYPLDSEKHCRAAWSYINQPANAAKYEPMQLKRIKARIKAAGKRYGIEFAESVGVASRNGGWRRQLREIIRKFNPGQLRDPHSGEWIDMPGGGGATRKLADIIDDVSFEALDDVTVYQGIREDGIIDLGIGAEGGPVARFSYRDVDAISDSAYRLWRKRDEDPADSDALFGLIDDDIVDTSGQRVYLAISQKQIYTADPDDPDDEDDFGPVLTVGIPTAKDSEESPDFHEFDLDRDGFDNLVGNLEAFRDYELVEVDAEGAGDYDVTLMSDHSIQLNDGSEGSTPTLSTDQAFGLAAAVERLLARELPDEPSDPSAPDVVDGEDLADNLDVSVLEDGSFVITMPHDDGYVGVQEWGREDVEQLADSLKTMVRKDRALPDSRPSGSPGGSVRSTVSRMLPYDPPHAPAGSPQGGQFTAGGGSGASTKRRRGAVQAKARPRKKAAPGSVLAYDPETNRGPGYGSKNGDDRVHMMQQALNRMGMTDAAGKELKDDGKLGPKTTAAIKKLQKALGLTPNGRVTPAMLELMKNADSLAALKKTVAAAKGAKKTMPARRSQILRSDVLTYDRSFPLDDIQISRSGDGRTVEAYAAMFGTPYEVKDQLGHYHEVIERAAFNRTLNGAGRNAMCLYNHGMTVHGTPSEMGSVPLGTPVEIKPDGRGLLTVTRYNKGPFADQVLESIRNGDIKAQSFRGQIFRSTPNGKVPRPRYGQPLPTVTRHELGLSDYGPTPVPVNVDAQILAVRSLTDLINDFASLTDDDRWELLRTLDIPTLDADPGNEELEDLDEEPEGEPAEEATATSDQSEPGAEEPPTLRSDVGHSGRLVELRRRIKVAMVTRGMR